MGGEVDVALHHTHNAGGQHAQEVFFTQYQGLTRGQDLSRGGVPCFKKGYRIRLEMQKRING